MAGFLRKKSKQKPAPNDTTAGPPAPSAPNVSAPTPLYARLAGGSAAQTQTAPTAARIVSGPMALGKRESVSHPRSTASGARRNVTGPAASSTSVATTKSSKYGVTETMGDAAFGYTSPPPAWRQPVRGNTSAAASSTSLATMRTVTETSLGPAFGDDAPPPPPEKPLPKVYPPREPNNLYSSVSPSRQFSNRVVPLETYNSRTTTSGQVSDTSADLRTFGTSVSIPSSSVLPPADPEKPLFPHESLFSTPKPRPIPTPDRKVSLNAHQPRIPMPPSPPQRRPPHEASPCPALEHARLDFAVGDLREPDVIVHAFCT
ncbi:hypothetical protein BDZ89DRAFT_546090 [Hymenopellis radicata]|nr:hypothetical protein BDZ89DRAFT_546090 [Hymenopellis radicata]